MVWERAEGLKHPWARFLLLAVQPRITNIQGHLRSLNLVPIKTAIATSY